MIALNRSNKSDERICMYCTTILLYIRLYYPTVFNLFHHILILFVSHHNDVDYIPSQMITTTQKYYLLKRHIQRTLTQYLKLVPTWLSLKFLGKQIHSFYFCVTDNNFGRSSNKVNKNVWNGTGIQWQGYETHLLNLCSYNS